MIGELDERPESADERSSATRSDDEFSASEKKCIASAMNILVYASNTEKRLREKLLRKGCSQSDVDAAVAYCKGKGYINDSSQLIYTAQVMASSKLYGKRRLVVELYKKGFRREDIAALDYDELDIDFPANCAALRWMSSVRPLKPPGNSSPASTKLRMSAAMMNDACTMSVSRLSRSKKDCSRSSVPCCFFVISPTLSACLIPSFYHRRRGLERDFSHPPRGSDSRAPRR